MSVLPTVEGLIRDGMEQGLHLGAQAAVSLRGERVASLALGEGSPGVAMQPDTLVLWLSSCKPAAAIAIGQLLEQGRLDLDDSVARHIPAFATGGKEEITLRHVLTHTGGFRPTLFRYPEDDWDTIIRTICDTPLEAGWTPGKKAGYHVHTGWFILGEVIQRVSGQAFPTYVRERIFQPLSMTDSWIGMPPDRYDAYGDRIGRTFDTTKEPPENTGWHERDWVTHCRPSGNGYGPMTDLLRLYEMLLGQGELDGTRILQPETVALLTTRHREGMFDHTFRAPMDWGLGFILNTPQDHTGSSRRPMPYGYGRHASASAFGHSGHQSSVAFADPEYGLAVAIAFNGCPGEPKHQRRIDAVLTALYEDLGLA